MNTHFSGRCFEIDRKEKESAGLAGQVMSVFYLGGSKTDEQDCWDSHPLGGTDL